MVGCAKTGEAIVIDPMRNIAPYLRMAEKEGLRITHVTETHIHADFVSGTRELAHATGAVAFLSDMGDTAWKYAPDIAPKQVLVREGDRFMVGNVAFDVMHTPGHTPEHIAFVMTDTAMADKPMGVFTGDFLFVGDVGRPDLLEEAAGMVGTAQVGAHAQYHTVARYKGMADYLQIFPAHGAGSACGKALGAVPSTTLGYEKLFNPAFQFDDEERFVAWLLDGQPEAPAYFARMKHVNKVGSPLLKDLPAPARLSSKELAQALQDGALVVDMRDKEAFARAHLKGTLSIPATSTTYSTYVGWFVDYARPFVFVAPDEASVDRILTDLRAIGVDNVTGYALPDALEGASESLPSMTAQELAQRLPKNGMVVLDVRGKGEYCEGHIAQAKHVALGFLPRHIDAIPRDKTVVTQCASGYRSQVAASWLRAHGFENVVNLTDGADVWQSLFSIAGCE
jgi:hydroxyacylglutathione hydrolase